MNKIFETKEMSLVEVNGYFVSGNKHKALVVNKYFPQEVHTFLPDPSIRSLNAFAKAVAWVSPGF